MGPKLKNQKKNTQKEERSARYINQRKKDSYLADDNNFDRFAKQLAKLGLEIRDITGDGNCLFRALSDQLEGTEGNHLTYRRQVCEYMRRNRADFEPFVVGLVDEIEHRKRGGGAAAAADKNLDPFDRYVNNLEQSGTYGGNDGLVAFSRLHNVDIYLHQLDQPVWRVNGAFLNAKNVKQLHLTYHNGEHYSSVRRMGDLDNTPANIQMNAVESAVGGGGATASKNNDKKKSNNYYDYSNNASSYYIDDDEEDVDVTLNKFNDLNFNSDQVEAMSDLDLDSIINITNCCDVNLIKEVYMENNRNTEATISRLISILNTTTSGGVDGTETVIVENNDETEEDNETKSNNKSGRRPQTMSAREKKQLKKQKQMERHRNKVLEEREIEKVKSSVPSVVAPQCAAAAASNNNNNQDDNFIVPITSNIEAKSI